MFDPALIAVVADVASASGMTLSQPPALLSLAIFGGVEECPADLDADGTVGVSDLAILVALWGDGSTTADIDDSGTVDAADLGVLLGAWGPCALQFDCNGNHIEDAVEIAQGLVGDCNQNGTPDDCEDCDENGIADDCDIAAGRLSDCNDDGLPDICEADCDGNGVADSCEPPSADCNENGRHDACDIAQDNDLDCDHDGVLDACAIAERLVSDCNANGVPDSCEEDCDQNGIPDDCDIALNSSLDCNLNGIPDACEVASDWTLDGNSNGLLDACEITADPSLDCDDDQLLDAYEILIDPLLAANGNSVLDLCEFAPPSPWDAIAFCPPSVDAPANVTMDFSVMPLPANFFGPGSEPFAAAVGFVANPLDPLTYGGASMLFHRSGDPFTERERGGVGHVVAIELVQLHLSSVAPAVVVINGEATAWSAEAVVLPGTSNGQLTADKLDSHGGMCTFTIDATLHVTFRSDLDGSVAIADLPMTLGAARVPWVHQPDRALALADDPTSAFTMAVAGPPGAQSVLPLPITTNPFGAIITCALQALKHVVRLDIHNGLDGRQGGAQLENAKKLSIGAVTAANLNDTDGDGKVDKDDDVVKAAAVNPTGTNEVDLMKLVINPLAAPAGGKVKLEATGGDIKLWEKSTKETAIALPAEFNVGDLPKTVWIEARAISTAVRDIGLKASYKGAVDEIRATGVWATYDSVRIERLEDFQADVENTLKTFVNSYKAMDESRFGLGPMVSDGTRDTRTGGRLLLEFKIAPIGADALPIVWDVSRRIEHRDHGMVSGSGTLADTSVAKRKTFRTTTKLRTMTTTIPTSRTRRRIGKYTRSTDRSNRL